ncbi:MAG: hypothetical protein ACTTJH_00720 [Bacteroidales bacterium]
MENQNSSLGRLYNCQEAANVLGISAQTLLRLRKKDEIKLMGITGKYFSIEQLRQIRNYLIHKS